MGTLDMERLKPRDQRPSAPAARDPAADGRGTAEVAHFSESERQELRNVLMHRAVDDEMHMDALRASLERVRSTIARLTKHETPADSWSKLAIHSALLRATCHPSHVIVRPDSLDKIWRQVGGYLSESIDKVRSDSHDE